MIRPTVGARLAIVLGLLVFLAGCGIASPTSSPPSSLLPGPADTPGPRTAAPSLVLPATPRPVVGLTWATAPDVERPTDAFAGPAAPGGPPAGPGTAGHPGHFPGQAILADVVTTPGGFVAVGYVGIEGRWSALAWTSTDALHWSLAPIDATPGSFAEAIAGGPGGLVAVGRSGPDPVAWTSPDGQTWTRHAVPTLGDGIEWERMTAVVRTGDGFLAGGSVGPELGDRRARLWRSADGAAWTPVPDEPSFGGAEVSALLSDATGAIALGRTGTGQRWTGSVAWSSSDGLHWQAADPTGALRDGLAVALVAGAGRVARRGRVRRRRARGGGLAVDRPGDLGPGAERGRAGSMPASKIRMTDVVTLGDELVAVGNYVGVQFGTGASWTSRDGLSWTIGPDQPALGQVEFEAVTAGRPRARRRRVVRRPGQLHPAGPAQSRSRPLTRGRAIGIRIPAVYPDRPMTTIHGQDSLARERAHELIRAFDGRAGSLGGLLGRVSPVDQVGVDERVEALRKRSIKKASKLWALDLAIRMIDLTTLEGKDTPGKIRALCAKAIHPQPGDPTIPSRRRDLRLPRARRRGARGARGRPASRSPASRPGSRAARRSSTSSSPRRAQAVEAGADEIDMVIDRGGVPVRRLPDRVRGDRGGQGGGRRRASQGHPRDRRARDATTTSGGRSILAMAAGADFIKTSTGKVTPAATLPGDAGHARGDPRLRARRPAAPSG